MAFWQHLLSEYELTGNKIKMASKIRIILGRTITLYYISNIFNNTVGNV